MTPILYQFLGLVLGFALWAFLGYVGKVPLDPLIALLQMALGGLITHMLRGLGEPAPRSSSQGGFVSLRLLISLAAVMVGLSILSGCASLTEAGHTAYSLKVTQDGCEVSAGDGKEFKSRTIMVDCARGQLAVNEEEAKAFKGQAISAKAAAVFPVTDLANIVVGNPDAPMQAVPTLPAASAAK